MVGITLSAEQVRAAPPEVRRWLEQEVIGSFGWESPPSELQATHLVACSVEEAFKVLSLVREMLPVVKVFFELGYQGTSVGTRGLVAFRLIDILRHVRLDNLPQVETCLGILNDALRHVRGAADATFYGLDGRGHCIVTEETQRSISRVWQETVAHHERETSGPARSAESIERPSGGTMSPYPVWTARARPMTAGLRAVAGAGTSHPS